MDAVTHENTPAPGSLLDLASATAGEIRRLLAAAREHDVLPRPVAPRGVLVANLFFEDSTRTRLSFTVAAARLGASTLDLAGKGSSLSKGESLADTARTIVAMDARVLIVRCAEPGGADLIARAVPVPVINAGDGRHAHPTQGLLDAYTLAEAHGRLDGFDLAGLRVVIVGDLLHSRVARSDITVLTALGARVTAVGPPALAPRSLEALGCSVTDDLDSALDGADAVQMLRVQRERGASAGSLASYTQGYQLTSERAARLGAAGVVMHPGPMNRGVEIEDAVADSPRSRITRQVAVGVMVRAAVLARALGKTP